MLPSWPSPLRHSHPCLSPTYTRSVLEGEFEFMRPSVRGTPTTHIAKDCSCGWRITLCTYLLQPWRGTARVLQSFGVCTAIQMQLEGRSVPCKQYYCCTRGLQQHIIICTEDVTAAHCKGYIQIFSRDTTASSLSSNSRTSAN